MKKRIVYWLTILALLATLSPGITLTAKAETYTRILEELAGFADLRAYWWSDSPTPYYTLAFRKPDKSGEAYRLTIGYHSPSSDDDVLFGTIKMTSPEAGIFSYKLRNGDGKIFHDGKLSYSRNLLTLIFTDSNNGGDRVTVIFRKGVQLVYQDGNSLENIAMSQPPEIFDGRVLVPMRSLFEFLGADVRWIKATRTVIAEKGDIRLEVAVGQREAKVNGRKVSLGTPARSVNGSVMVPLRFVSETLNYRVGWSEAALSATIIRPEEG